MINIRPEFVVAVKRAYVGRSLNSVAVSVDLLPGKTTRYYAVLLCGVVLF